MMLVAMKAETPSSASFVGGTRHPIGGRPIPGYGFLGWLVDSAIIPRM